MASQFDELNILNTDSQEITRSMPYEEYFGEMDITDKQKEERIAIAKDFEGMALFLMALFVISGAFSHSDRDFIKKQAKQAYLDVLQKHNAASDSMREHAQDFARDFVRTTSKNADDAWYQSEDRARFIAENEANVTANNADYEQALAEGKTHKRWITMNDAKVRHTHRDVNGKMIPIGEAFYVGSSMMMYPKDDSMGASASEIANCRCSVEYSNENNSDDDFLDFQFTLKESSNTTAGQNRDTLASFTRAWVKLPPKVQDAFKDITIEFGYAKPACSPSKRIIRVSVDMTEKQVYHEIGHLVETYLMDENKVQQYKKYLVDGLGKDAIISEIYRDSMKNEIRGFAVESTRLEHPYQSRLYVSSVKQALNADGRINVDKMKEAISVPFAKYMSGEEVSDFVKELIEDAIYD